MNLEETLMKQHSSAVKNQIILWVGDSESRLQQLLALVESDASILAQRASWPLTYIVEKYPHLGLKFQPRFLELLRKENKHEAVRRNILRAFTYMPVEESIESEMFDVASALLSSSESTVAVQVHAMQVMYDISKPYPELQEELKLEIERQGPFQSTGFKSRAKKILFKIDKNKGS